MKQMNLTSVLVALNMLERGKGRRHVAAAAAASMLVLTTAVQSATAADLTIGEGAVVKFGADASLVVRDRVTVQRDATLTSERDSAVGGTLSAGLAAPAQGVWRGVRLEKSSSAYGVTLTDALIRYAGADNTAALTIRGFSPSLSFLRITDSTVGVRSIDGGSPTLSGLLAQRNAIGIEADGNATPTITQSTISQNTSGIVNRTPSSVVQATSNWWGDLSGPKDAAGNPQGLGDSVSAGVNYAAYLASAPLTNPNVRLASAAPFIEQSTVRLLLSCTNATEYRIAENAAFAGLPFSPMTDGRASVDFGLSTGDGTKSISVQYRNAAGNVITANLVGGVLLDTQGPTVALTTPSPDSIVSGQIDVAATAADASGVARLQFYVDGTLAATDTAAPYGFAWNTEAIAEGAHQLRVVATDVAGRTFEQTQSVTVARYVPPPDIDGPALSNVKLDAAVFATGATITRNGAITVSITDRSGISRVELLIDGVVNATASAAGSTYTALLNIDNVTNGAHTIVLRALDSLNNTSTATFDITVAHAPPPPPTISQPANGLATRTGSVIVSGSAQIGTRVQIFLNSVATGTPLDVTASGSFTTSLTLVEGQNRIQAQTIDRWGTSTLSGNITVTLDTAVPVAPSNLAALAQSGGVIKLSWQRSSDASVVGYDVYRSSVSFTSIAEGVRINLARLTGTALEDTPRPDGTYFYRVVAVNAAGTPSAPTNLAQGVADGTAPRAAAIVYQPLGKFDEATGRYGQGRVNVTLDVSEVLQAAPYLALTLEGAAPITIDLVKQTDTRYTGGFNIDALSPSGVATAIFSARDVIGNRGTDVDSGRSITIDAEGPALTGIAVSPAAPIRADAAPPVTATFTFSKAVKTGTSPELAYLLSGVGRTATSITGLTQVDATTWRGTFTMPANAGQSAPEFLSFAVRAQDVLDNISNKVSAANRFQVYQGNLPPADIPVSLTAKAQAGGKVQLTWSAVNDAAAYQVYRQAPGDTALTALNRATTATYLDTTPQDGAYKYSVASVRQANAQEALSAQSNIVDVNTSSQAPGAPQNLVLDLTSQGIRARWQEPAGGNVATYNVYRTTSTQINSIEGLTPFRTGIKTTAFVDANPTGGHAYVITALDFAGNESAISNSAYLNAALLPVRNLQVAQIGTALPVLTWTAPSGSLAGYNVYVGPDTARVKLTPSPITALTFTDTGFVSGERLYTVASVDSNSVEMPHSLLLPSVTTQIVSGLPLKRGVMNRVQVQVSNTSATSMDNARVIVRAGGVDHPSEPFTLAASGTRIVPVVVGGYHDLPNPATLAVGIDIQPNESERVQVSADTSAEVFESALTVGFATENFTRGGTGRVRLTIQNTTDVDIELLTARSNGNAPSDELRFKLLDADNNVLATQSFQQAFGSGVVTLTNGSTVARIAAGSTYTSDPFDIRVPSTSPDRIRVQLEVDKLRYHTGEADQIAIRGRGSETQVTLVDTAYYGEVTNVAPAISYGDVDVVISGRALDRTTQQPLASSRLKLLINQEGFERSLAVTTDSAGQFVYRLAPGASEGGFYKVAAVHPDISDRPEQRTFVINRVRLTPSWKVSAPPNYAYTFNLQAMAGPGTTANNLRLVLNPLSQPGGQVPEGLALTLPAPVNITARQSLQLPVTFMADSRAAAKGAAILDVLADGTDKPIGQVRVEWTLTEAKPFLSATPGLVNTGLAQGTVDTESLTLENKGVVPLSDLRLSLTNLDGSAAPTWLSLVTPANLGSLALGDKRSVEINFAPPADLQEGVYQFRLKAEGANYPADSLPVFVSITQSGIGNVLVKTSDIYTATLNRSGQLIQGLENASIEVQNEDVPSIRQTRMTDSFGEAFFEGLPAGRYKFRARAANHQEQGGRFQVKPGVTLTQPIFLDYNLVTVEWSVREITIEDRYEITLNATFETDVPAAVVVLEPPSINLPKMKVGEVFQGELTLTNYGLIRADDVRQQLPTPDQFFKFEFLATPPSSLEAKQRVRLPYRVIALKSLEEEGQATGGGCYSYLNSMLVPYKNICANGSESSGVARAYWSTGSSSTCPGGIGGIGGGGGGGGGGGPSTWFEPAGYTTLEGLQPCVKCAVTVCDRCQRGGGGGGGGGEK